jgi:hypothetical protein
MPRNYVSLLQLITDWADQSGELHVVVLNNLCDQEEHGRFPDQTFVDSRTGGFGEAGSLRRFVHFLRSVSGFMEPEEIKRRFESVAVSKEGVLQFCKAYGVRPPHCVAPKRQLPWIGENSRLAPPPYPATPEEIATEETKRREAEAQEKALYEETAKRNIEKSLESMRNILTEIEKLKYPITENKRFHYERQWGWCELSINGSLGIIEELNYASAVTQELERLNSEFDAFLAREAEKLENDASREEPDRKTEPPTQPTISAETCAKKYLKKQVAEGNRLPRRKHFELAKKECGENLAERGFDRAWKDIAPPDWKKPGRPKREDDDYGAGSQDSK